MANAQDKTQRVEQLKLFIESLKLEISEMENHILLGQIFDLEDILPFRPSSNGSCDYKLRELDLAERELQSLTETQSEPERQ